MVFLEWLAIGLRAECRRYESQAEEASRLQALLNASDREVTERRGRLNELSDQIDKHLRYVDDRWIRHTNRQEIETVAVAAILRGYADGLVS